jgi:hypothetical protein
VVEDAKTIQYFTRLDGGDSPWYSVVTEVKDTKEVSVRQLPIDKIPEEIL